MNNFPSEMHLYVPKYVSLNIPNKEFGDNILIIFQCYFFQQEPVSVHPESKYTVTWVYL